MQNKKTGVLLIQIGSPASPSVSDVRSFLKKFLSDPQVVDKQSFWWKLLLNGIILPLRSRKSAANYRKIWDGSTFPLFKYSEAFAEQVKKNLADRPDLLVRYAYSYCAPTIEEELKKLYEQDCRKILIVPMYPQYSESTTGAVKDAVHRALAAMPADLEMDFVDSFYTCPAYINSTAELINNTLKGQPVESLVISFHGYPLRRITDGDPYYRHCVESAKWLANRVTCLGNEYIHLSFQSKFGQEHWLEPSTRNKLLELASSGVKKIAVVCPGFTVDNLETLDEIGCRLKEEFMAAGGEEVILIPCLNDNEQWAEKFTEGVILPRLAEEKSEAETHELDPKEACSLLIPQQEDPLPALPEKTRSILNIMFIVLFLDLVGFSIIFPLFPAMMKYYISIQGREGLFGSVLNFIESLAGQAGTSKESAVIVLFGGFLVFLYSILQFLMAPVAGALSDRFGRKPILVIAVGGLAVSYLMWFFAGTFELLVLSRLLGGLMGSNISVASAVVADVTEDRSRSRGMAVIGIAFGIGFIAGPFLGGLSSLADLSQFATLAQWGVNPFSFPALIAFSLSVFNLFLIIKKFPETLAQSSSSERIKRTVNPFKIMEIKDFPGVKKVVWAHFIFLLLFSGAEFTLTFLAAERLGYSSLQNGLMFLYIGLILAAVQGGYVRRKAHIAGEENLSVKGFILLCMGLVMTGLAHSSWMLYAGLFFMAIGPAMIIPCLTALVSLKTPSAEQGRVIGIFRSLGALARTLGPLSACLIYWKFGAGQPYYLAAVFMLAPLLIIKSLKK